MLSVIAKYILPRVLRNRQWNKLGFEDPYFEYVPIDEHGKVKYYKKLKRRIPDGISQNDLAILRTFRKRAYKYDCMLSIGSMKFGYASIMKIIPILGTIVTLYWSLKLITLTWGLDDGCPWNLQAYFILNLIIDFTFGSIPFVGMIFEIGYKANSRNCLLLERHLIKVGEKNLQSITDREDQEEVYNWKDTETINNDEETSNSKLGLSSSVLSGTSLVETTSYQEATTTLDESDIPRKRGG